MITSKYGFITTKKRSDLMKKIKSCNTKSEILLRKKLWNAGFRYYKNYKKLPGKPDIVFVKYKIAIFVDGEFWHGFNWKEKKEKIKSNRDYWLKKIEKNIKRDKKINSELKKMGWTVLRFWEKEIKNNLDNCLLIIVKCIEKKKLCQS